MSGSSSSGPLVQVDDPVADCLDGDILGNTFNYGIPENAEYNGVKGQRATAASACVVSTDRVPGKPATPFGYDSGTMHKSHLIGRQFGGSNDVKNIVPLYINVNTPVMRDVERTISNAVRQGHRIFYEVTPLYEGSSPIPYAVDIEAIGVSFTCRVIIRNDRSKSGQRAQC